jgi:hypothetical protein
LDLARHLPRDLAVRHLDALACATDAKAADVLLHAERHPRARGLPRARAAAGFGAPRTQIRVSDGINEAFIDMGYDEPMVGFDYEGEHHSTERGQYVHDIGRAELIDREGWIDIRVVREHRRQFVLHRAVEAFRRRGWEPPRLRRGL